MRCPIRFISDNSELILVDDWIENYEDMVFKHAKNVIVLPITKFYGIEDEGADKLDYFHVSSKRCYNDDSVRICVTHYLNYFNKFYDPDQELISMYARTKLLMDTRDDYDETAFMYDLKTYLLSKTMLDKAYLMNEHNYGIDLEKNKRDGGALQYTNKHGRALTLTSLLMKFMIPLICHFAHKNKILNVNDFVLKCYELIFQLFAGSMDLENKLTETAIYRVTRSYNIHTPLWAMQDIRGNTVTTHILDCVKNIKGNVMPKAVYYKNIVVFIDDSIKRNTGYQITDAAYEYSFSPLSSSERDEDDNSAFDKFESSLVKKDRIGLVSE